MKNSILAAFLSLIFLTIHAQTNPIFPLGKKAPNVHHTGDVWLHYLSHADSQLDVNIVTATFAPNAKLNWHLHPAGQKLLILKGEGYYQEKGKPVRLVQEGEVIECTPNTEHWHSSTPTSGVTYLAISGNQKTIWTSPVTEEYYQSIDLSTEKKVQLLSVKKWQWMADKNTEELEKLFHHKAKFVHMGGTWGKEKELEIIKSGGIHYKKADIHNSSIDIIGNTAIVLHKITLLAVVGSKEVTNPFEVTEVYVQEHGSWKLTNLSFTKLLQ